MAEMADCPSRLRRSAGHRTVQVPRHGHSAVDGKDSSCYALILPGMGVLQVAGRRVQYR